MVCQVDGEETISQNKAVLIFFRFFNLQFLVFKFQ